MDILGNKTVITVIISLNDPDYWDYTITNIANGGINTDNIDIVYDCLVEYMGKEKDKLPKEGHVTLLLGETGEWQDVFWVSYFQVMKVIDIYNYN